MIEVFDRRLAIHPAEKQAGEQGRGALFDGARGFPGHRAQIGGGQGIEALQEALAGARDPDAFEEHVVEAEGEIEGRVAVPRALGVEEHRALRADEDVLRAHIPVHQCKSCSCRSCDQIFQYRRKSGMNLRSSQEIGLEADGMEILVGVEFRGAVLVAGSRRMDARKAAADLRGEVAVGAAFGEFGFPERIALEQLHREAARVIRREHFRRHARDDRVGGFHPHALVAVALDRHLPELFHPQARQRTLDADRSAAQVYAPDVGGHAARERRRGRNLVGSGEAVLAQEREYRLREQGARSSTLLN